MKQWFLENKTSVTLAGYLLFSVLVTALPRNRKDFDLYTYCWDVLHGIAGTLNARFAPPARVEPPAIQGEPHA